MMRTILGGRSADWRASAAFRIKKKNVNVLEGMSGGRNENEVWEILDRFSEFGRFGVIIRAV